MLVPFLDLFEEVFLVYAVSVVYRDYFYFSFVVVEDCSVLEAVFADCQPPGI